MKDKNNMVVAVGLIVIFIIVALIVYGINDYTKQFTKETDAVNSLAMQQKDLLIRKLVKKLNEIRKELSSIREKISGIAADINK
jgi:hypothetical protein